MDNLRPALANMVKVEPYCKPPGRGTDDITGGRAVQKRVDCCHSVDPSESWLHLSLVCFPPSYLSVSVSVLGEALKMLLAFPGGRPVCPLCCLITECCLFFSMLGLTLGFPPEQHSKPLFTYLFLFTFLWRQSLTL